MLTHSPERNGYWYLQKGPKISIMRLLTTVFTVMRRKLKKEEMEKQLDPNTLKNMRIRALTRTRRRTSGWGPGKLEPGRWILG